MFLQVKRMSSAVLLSVAIMLALVCILPQVAHGAEPAIRIQRELGYGGTIKLDRWSPLTITLTSDVDVSGEIVVQAEYSSSSSSFYNGSASYVKKIDLPAGTPKKVTLGIPGNSFNKNNSSIRFYKGSAESGKYIPFTEGMSYLVSTAEQGTLIGVLAADPDSLNFLKSLNGNSRNLTIIPLKGEQIPEDAVLLDSLDVIVINNYSTDSLGSDQISAIHSWVVKGGTLVLAGGSGYPKSIAGLEDLSPVEYIGNTDINSFNALEKVGDKPLAVASSFPISQAKPKEGVNVSLQVGAIPFFALWSVGKGEVHYAAYDIAMEPLNSWSGHGELWSVMLQQKLPVVSSMKGSYNSESFISRVGYLLDYFPSLTLPPFSLLIWMLLAYAFLVAPVLYYVLKKLDKREWAWLLIPVIAVLASGGIYIAGTAGKSSVLSHTFNVMELDGQGYANRSTASALFVPRGGNYKLEFAEGTHVKVQREDGLLSGGQAGGADRQYIDVQDDETTVKLKDMTHRSIAKVWTEVSERREFGSVDIQVTYDEKGQAQGTVINKTTVDLNNAALILGRKVILLGDLPKNKSLSIPTATNLPTYDDYGSLLFPQSSNYNRNDEWERERGLVNNYINNSNVLNKNVLIAWNKEPLSSYKVDGKNVKSEGLNMWVQSVVPKFEDQGKLDIPFGLITGRVSSTSSSQWSEEGLGRIQISNGHVVIDYSLPKKGIEYSLLEIRQGDSYQGDFQEGVTTEILNNESNEWETLNWSKGKIEFTGNVNSYIKEGAILQIRITSTNWIDITFPEISLKGRDSR